MNPSTGEFHALAEREEARSEVYKNHKGEFPLAAKHADLVIAASKKPVPSNWPIFKRGESYVFEINGVFVTWPLLAVRQKDLLFQDSSPMNSATLDMLRHARFEAFGHEFRVRKIHSVLDAGEPAYLIVVRPVVGKAPSYISED